MNPQDALATIAGTILLLVILGAASVIEVEERHLPPSALSRVQRLIPAPIRLFWWSLASKGA
jgi:hypothetical protein